MMVSSKFLLKSGPNAFKNWVWTKTDFATTTSMPLAPSKLERQLPTAMSPFSEPIQGPNIETLRKAKVSPTILKPFVDPTLHTSSHDFFEKEVTVERLFNARVHFGHKVGTLNDNMKWALYGERLGVCVFDLDITRRYMIKALQFVTSLAYSGGRFLFVTTNKSAMLMVEEKAEQLGQYAHTRQWKSGAFTNIKGIFRAPIRLPDTLIMLNTLTSAMEGHPALIEAAKMCIPTVAIIDSNSEPNYVTYPIPGNDDSIESINFYMEMFAKAIQKGQAESRRNVAQADEVQPQQQQTTSRDGPMRERRRQSMNDG